MKAPLLLLTITASVLSVPVDKAYDSGRENGTPRLLRAGWRLSDGSTTDEGSYGYTDPFGKRRGDHYTSDEGGFVPRDDHGPNIPSEVDQSVDQVAQQSERKQIVRDFDVARSLGRSTARPRRPQPPFYRGSEYLAEKPALPPHVLKARSGDTFRVRSRSRPVYRPLYTSSDHLAERPAIPIPQIEAYESSRGPVGLIPYVEEVVQEEPSTEKSTNAAREEVTVVPLRFSKPSAVPDVTTYSPGPVLAEGDAVELDAKPDSTDENKDDASSNVQTTTQAPTQTQGTTYENTPEQANALSYSSTLEESFPSAPLTSLRPEEPFSTTTVSTSAKTEEADGLVLYSDDAEVAPEPSRRHPVPPLTTPPVLTSPKPPSASSLYPPRKRYTFKPFVKTSAVTVPTTVATVAVQDVLYSGVGTSGDNVQERVPAVSVSPSAGFETTRNLLISTEPTVHENDNIPEVPQEPEEQETTENRDELTQGVTSVPQATEISELTKTAEEKVAEKNGAYSEVTTSSTVVEPGAQVVPGESSDVQTQEVPSEALKQGEDGVATTQAQSSSVLPLSKVTSETEPTHASGVEPAEEVTSAVSQPESTVVPYHDGAHSPERPQDSTALAEGVSVSQLPGNEPVTVVSPAEVEGTSQKGQPLVLSTDAATLDKFEQKEGPPSSESPESSFVTQNEESAVTNEDKSETDAALPSSSSAPSTNAQTVQSSVTTSDPPYSESKAPESATTGPVQPTELSTETGLEETDDKLQPGQFARGLQPAHSIHPDSASSKLVF
ncbi:mucin-5AC-like [Ornithodoros turicata]|uniref:mucin-5AC-like n=1 Tax=Ornithodoros turicata TaxID=34597 RepID=UPI003138B567